MRQGGLPPAFFRGIEMDFESLIDEIPNYQRFFKVDELDQRTDELAKKYPKTVEVRIGGYSRQGHPIKVIKIGHGSRNALLFGCPHPNEPIGAMMLDFLAEKLASDERFRSQFDYTWYLIKVIDPDGTKLNEGWFSNPESIRTYAEHFYRPPGYLQVEWTFPVDYKTLHFHNPLPETKVLMNIIDETKPAFMYSLHNAGFGGVYYYISEEVRDVEELHRNHASAFGSGKTLDRDRSNPRKEGHGGRSVRQSLRDSVLPEFELGHAQKIDERRSEDQKR